MSNESPLPPSIASQATSEEFSSLEEYPDYLVKLIINDFVEQVSTSTTITEVSRSSNIEKKWIWFGGIFSIVSLFVCTTVF